MDQASVLNLIFQRRSIRASTDALGDARKAAVETRSRRRNDQRGLRGFAERFRSRGVCGIASFGKVGSGNAEKSCCAASRDLVGGRCYIFADEPNSEFGSCE